MVRGADSHGMIHRFRANMFCGDTLQFLHIQKDSVQCMVWLANHRPWVHLAAHNVEFATQNVKSSKWYGLLGMKPKPQSYQLTSAIYITSKLMTTIKTSFFYSTPFYTFILVYMNSFMVWMTRGFSTHLIDYYNHKHEH